MKHTQYGGIQFTEEGRVAEITNDLVLQARAKMAGKKSMDQKTPS